MQDGGLLYVLDGQTGGTLPGFPKQIDEVMTSSPALGDINNDGFLEIVVGTGLCWKLPGCAPGGDVKVGVGRNVHAWDHLGDPLPGWPFDLSQAPADVHPDTYVAASPALADLDEDGFLDVIVNTANRTDATKGQTFAINKDGQVIASWPVKALVALAGIQVSSTESSVIVADLTNDGDLEVVQPGGGGFRTHRVDSDRCSAHSDHPIRQSPGDAQPADERSGHRSGGSGGRRRGRDHRSRGG